MMMMVVVVVVVMTYDDDDDDDDPEHQTILPLRAAAHGDEYKPEHFPFFSGPCRLQGDPRYSAKAFALGDGPPPDRPHSAIMGKRSPSVGFTRSSRFNDKCVQKM
jgi:hypothetical protein